MPASTSFGGGGGGALLTPVADEAAMLALNNRLGQFARLATTGEVFQQVLSPATALTSWALSTEIGYVSNHWQFDDADAMQFDDADELAY